MKTNPFFRLLNHLFDGMTRDYRIHTAESSFSKDLIRHLSVKTTITSDYILQTIGGKVHYDLMIELNKQKIAIEYKDGKDYDQIKDEWRDAFALGTGSIDTIYRFAGRDMDAFRNDSVYFISRFNPEIFEPHSRLFNSHFQYDDKERTTFYYNMITDQDELVGRLKFIIEKRNKADKLGNWNKLWLFAMAQKNPELIFLSSQKTGSGQA